MTITEMAFVFIIRWAPAWVPCLVLGIAAEIYERKTGIDEE